MMKPKVFFGCNMCWNPALTMKMVKSCPKFQSIQWKADMNSSRHMNIKDILKHPELEWDWRFVSENLGLTMKILLANLDKPWVWSFVSKHKNIKMSDQSHMDLPWVWYFHAGVSGNPNLTMTMIEAHPDKPWNWRFISESM